MLKWTKSAAAIALLSCSVMAYPQSPQSSAPAQSQPATAAPTSFKALHLMGFGAAGRNSSGVLAAKSGVLHFQSNKISADVPAASIQDVITDEDSKRLIRGTLQALSMFAPYGGGRFLSLFREKVDVLTVEYRDETGGLHGGIFQLPHNQAPMLKKQLLEQGARTTVPLEQPSDQPKAGSTAGAQATGVTR